MLKPIVVIGSSNIDLVMKMDRLPRRDESIPNAEFIQVFGGKGANQAVAAARAGGNVSFVNCVGDDPYAAEMVDSYRQSGVDTTSVFFEQDVPSGTALIMIGENGHNYLSVAPGANHRLTADKIDQIEDMIQNAAYILMQFEILPETIDRVLKIAGSAGVPVVWNVAPAQEFDREWLKSIEILVVNEPEATMVSGIEVSDTASGSAAAQKIITLGAQKVIVTLGADGSVLADGDGQRHIPAFPVEPVDTTAAGDTYCGCLAVALSEGKTLAEAVMFASAAAALSVQKLGAQPSTPWRTEIDTFLKERIIE